jgi:hypothetical protein
MSEPTTSDEFHNTRPDLVEAGWPPHLVASVIDPFEYILHLRTGETIRYLQAIPGKTLQWVTLMDLDFLGGDEWQVQFKGDFLSALAGEPDPALPPRRLPFSRGLNVRVADIVWVANWPWR